MMDVLNTHPDKLYMLHSEEYGTAVAIMLCWCVCRDCSCFLVLVATCVFGTYLQSGTCVVSCDNATIGDSNTQECRDVLGELAVLVHSNMALFNMQYVAQMHSLLMAALIICTIFLWQFSKVIRNSVLQYNVQNQVQGDHGWSVTKVTTVILHRATPSFLLGFTMFGTWSIN